MKTLNPNLSDLGIHAKGCLMASAIAASLSVVFGLSYAEPVIHEPFEFVPPDTSLAGNPGGTGLSGNWTTSSAAAVEAANLTYGSLSTSASATVASGYNNNNVRIGIGATTLNGLLNDGGGLWMSFLYRTGDNAGSARFAIGLGDTYLSGNGNLLDEDANAATAEQAIGFALPFNAAHGGIPMIWDTNIYDGGNINADPTFVTPPSTSPGLTSGSTNNFGFYPDNDTTYLFVLHAQWGADGSTNDTVTLYTPGTDLALGTAVTTYQAIVSQDSFDTLFFTADQNIGILDEIRVGATYADVVPSTGGGSAFDTWATSGTVTGVTFGGDANGDGVKDGLAFLLGATTPDDDASGLLPTASEDGGLVMNFSMLDPASSAPAVLSLSHSGDLGITDPWSVPVAVPATTSTMNGIEFVVSGSGPLSVIATIPASGNALDGKLFGRLVAEE